MIVQFYFSPNVETPTDLTFSSSQRVQPLYIEESFIPSDVDWAIFQSKKVEKPVSTLPLDQLYVLRGTFIVDQNHDNIHRKAIIDDLQNNSQLIISEQQELSDGRKVIEIVDDQVTLLNGTTKEILTLPFVSINPDISASTTVDTAKPDTDLTNKFGGKKTGNNEWEFKKDKIMKYYDDLMADPKRLLNLFDSFAPVYNEDRKITGYKIDIKGEKEFINAVGLQNGDYITKVNALRLTNRRRAEYMIGEFIEGRASSFALEVERDETPQNLIYRTY
ncbi:MAG: hypothetical protein PF692_08405 [Kiritimatiellae bacterium]|nr:hypothetical protein [Kiritimatiellia bacterium]